MLTTHAHVLYGTIYGGPPGDIKHSGREPDVIDDCNLFLTLLSLDLVIVSILTVGTRWPEPSWKTNDGSQPGGRGIMIGTLTPHISKLN